MGHTGFISNGFLEQEGIKCTTNDMGFQTFTVKSVVVVGMAEVGWERKHLTLLCMENYGRNQEVIIIYMKNYLTEKEKLYPS